MKLSITYSADLLVLIVGGLVGGVFSEQLLVIAYLYTDLLVLIVGGLVAGVFSVAACQVQRHYRRRQRRQIPSLTRLPFLDHMTTVDGDHNGEASVGLLGATSDDDEL